MMKKILILIFFLKIVHAEELLVVTNQEFQDLNLTVKEISDIFLDKQHFIDNRKVLVMNFKANTPLRKCFEEKVLQKSKRSLERYWRKAYYLGKRPPKVIASIEMLFSYIENISPAIGYSDLNNTQDRNVNVLFRVECDLEQ